ncbi:MAG: hypothetical protein J5894_00820, partial [Clostridia bacterium]|nr:hypothetical protein [Clostridia bacterium]
MQNFESHFENNAYKKINLKNATAVQRASDDGITAFVPLPVGPVENGGKNVYPQLKVWLAFDDN